MVCPNQVDCQIRGPNGRCAHTLGNHSTHDKIRAECESKQRACATATGEAAEGYGTRKAPSKPTAVRGGL